MSLGYAFAGKTYSRRQVAAVLTITLGAGLATLGCYRGGQAAAAAAAADATTPTPLFVAGLGLLLLNLLNDSGLNVLQAKVFAPHIAADKKAAARSPAPVSVVDEAMVVMSVCGTCLMTLVAGKEVLAFLTAWAAAPTWHPLASGLPTPVLAAAPPLFAGAAVPVEVAWLVVNFIGTQEK